MKISRIPVLVVILFGICVSTLCHAFIPLSALKSTTRAATTSLEAVVSQNSHDEQNGVFSSDIRRRQVLIGTAGSLAGMLLSTATTATAAHAATAAPPTSSLSNKASLIADLQLSLDKLKPIPSLLQKNEWDSVRTILKTPPVNQLWNLADAKNPLALLARATDEVELIDLKDELSLSLQMCDQLTYDNVFVYYQPGNGKVKVKEPIDLAEKAMSQLSQAIDLATMSSAAAAN